MALGHKRVETRGWSTRYRGLLAIHAAKRWTAEERELAAAHGLCGLPLGAIVAVGMLMDVMPTNRVAHMVGSQELAWGDYGPGRFAWLFDDVETLSEPIPYKGSQGFFELSGAATVKLLRQCPHARRTVEKSDLFGPLQSTILGRTP